MKAKKHQLFLWISFSIFILSALAILISALLSYHQTRSDFQDDPARAFSEFGFGALFMALISTPFLGAQLSFIRSVYKGMKHRPQRSVSICYLISAVLAGLAIVVFCLSFFGWIDLNRLSSSDNLTAYTLLYTQWPLFLLSFLLGSAPAKHPAP